jgi:hypothetical protein
VENPGRGAQISSLAKDLSPSLCSVDRTSSSFSDALYRARTLGKDVRGCGTITEPKVEHLRDLDGIEVTLLL